MKAERPWWDFPGWVVILFFLALTVVFVNELTTAFSVFLYLTFVWGVCPHPRDLNAPRLFMMAIVNGVMMFALPHPVSKALSGAAFVFGLWFWRRTELRLEADKIARR